MTTNNNYYKVFNHIIWLGPVLATALFCSTTLTLFNTGWFVPALLILVANGLLLNSNQVYAFAEAFYVQFRFIIIGILLSCGVVALSMALVASDVLLHTGITITLDKVCIVFLILMFVLVIACFMYHFIFLYITFLVMSVVHTAVKGFNDLKQVHWALVFFAFIILGLQFLFWVLWLPIAALEFSIAQAGDGTDLSVIPAVVDFGKALWNFGAVWDQHTSLSAPVPIADPTHSETGCLSNHLTTCCQNLVVTNPQEFKEGVITEGLGVVKAGAELLNTVVGKKSLIIF